MKTAQAGGRNRIEFIGLSHAGRALEAVGSLPRHARRLEGRGVGALACRIVGRASFRVATRSARFRLVGPRKLLQQLARATFRPQPDVRGLALGIKFRYLVGHPQSFGASGLLSVHRGCDGRSTLR